MILRRLLPGLLSLAGASAAPQAQWISVYGVSHGDETVGEELRGVGDVDQDGVPDFASIVYHLGERFVRVFSGANGAPLRQFESDEDTAHAFGLVLASGDLDLDGRADLIVSDFLGTPDGQVFAFSGADGGLLWKVVGPGGSRFGRSVAVLGDLDGDGGPDLLVGAPEFDSPGRGRFYVLSGSDGGLIRAKSASSKQYYLGFAASGVGDVDADGVPDYAVSAFDGKLPWESRGAVFLYSGQTGAELRSWTGTHVKHYLGWSLAAAGDVNQDGAADLLVGAPGDDGAATDGGAAFVFSGADGTVLRTHLGAHAADGFGTVVESLGDVDGDGRGDYAVGAPLADENGQDSGAIWVFSGADGATLQAVPGDGPSLQFGASLSGLCDVDGDGRADWVGGAPYDHPAHTLGGYARVFVGDCAAGGATYCETSPNSAGPGALIGFQGSTHLGANDLVLTVTRGVPHQFGYFFYGQVRTSTPVGDGRLCVRTGTLPLFRILPPVMSDASGQVVLHVDVTQAPMGGGPGAWEGGAVWQVQYAYRDPGGPLGTGLNFTDALILRFCE